MLPAEEWALPNCPPNYYFRCANHPYSCKGCSAGKGGTSSSLRFKDSKGELQAKDHPHYKVAKTKPSVIKAPIDKLKSKQVKQGFGNERQLLKQTVRSGAAYQDGDLHALDGFIRIDSKRRHNTQSFTVSAAEYQKGKRQGITTWMITVGPNDKPNTMVCMELETYQHLLTLAQERLDLLNNKE